MSKPTGGAEPSYLSLNSCTSADIFEASDAECDVEKLVRRDAIFVIVLLGLLLLLRYPLDIEVIAAAQIGQISAVNTIDCILYIRGTLLI